MASTNSGPRSGFNDLVILLVVLVVVLVIILVGLIIYLWKKGYFSKPEEKEAQLSSEKVEDLKEEKSDVERMKNEELGSLDEVAVIRALEKKEGVLQKELPEITNLSKATISRIIARLEEKGKIERRPYKRTNMVFLAKKEE